MSEAAFQRMVEQACQWNGLTVYHTFDSRRSNPGFPDLVIVGARGVLFRELKTNVGRLTPMQKFWLEILRRAGQNADVWRPSDFQDRVLPELKALGRVGVDKPTQVPRKYRKAGGNGTKPVPNDKRGI